MDHNASGQLEVITGCMFSGKTEEMIRRLKRVLIANRKFLLLKPTIDDRYGPSIVNTHDGYGGLNGILLKPGEETTKGLQFVLGYNDMKPTSIKEVSSVEFVARIEETGKSLIDEADVIAFDEGQFFSEKLPALCEELVAMGKRVIVAGLDLNFAGEPFWPMPNLMALADYVDKFQAVCVICGGTATRTQRLDEHGNPVSGDQPEIVVGGITLYQARCHNCQVNP